MINFEDGISEPENWFRQAWEMYEASKTVYQALADQERPRTEQDNYRRVGLMKGAMLMLGLSAENALKGALVFQSKPDVSKGKMSSGHFHEKPHDLIEVAEKLDLDLTGKQKDLLVRLTLFVQWASKYQVPLREYEYINAQGKLTLTYPSDYAMVEELILALQRNCGFNGESGWA